MRQSAVSFESEGLKLEGVLGCPDEASGPAPGVVICHPHPQRGGDMNNNLVISLYMGLVEAGFAALRFNFRGTGNSEGEHGGGEREPEDALAALAFLKDHAQVDAARLGMAGYSFGTGVLLRALPRYTQAKVFALFSSPVRYLEEAQVQQDARPRLFVCGDRDHAVEVSSLKAGVEALGSPAELQVVSGADHFWLGQESEAVGHGVEFFSRCLKGP